MQLLAQPWQHSLGAALRLTSCKGCQAAHFVPQAVDEISAPKSLGRQKLEPLDGQSDHGMVPVASPLSTGEASQG